MHYLELTEYLIYGITLGLAAGIAPGPLLTMVISETLKGNKINGMLIAIAPLITDLPIVFFSIFILNSFSNTEHILGILSITGGIFLIYLAVQNFRFNPKTNNTKSGYGSSIKYGIITNILSPHPYLFWITIGAPIFIKASKSGASNSFAFIIGFYLLLVSSKVVIALISSKVKGFLNSTSFNNTMKLMGGILLLLSGVMIYEGFLMVWYL